MMAWPVTNPLSGPAKNSWPTTRCSQVQAKQGPSVGAWQVLLPVQEACTEFLHGPGMKPILSSINTAAATCQSGH